MELTPTLEGIIIVLWAVFCLGAGVAVAMGAVP